MDSQKEKVRVLILPGRELGLKCDGVENEGVVVHRDSGSGADGGPSIERRHVVASRS